MSLMSVKANDTLHVPDGSPAAVSDRESLAATIRAFLDSEITAFEFDERLEDFRDSEDPVLQYVAVAVWHYYDDCDDHLVCMNREEWNFLQRLLLMLSSDCTLEIQSQRIWSFRQLIAAACLIVFIVFAVQAGWGHHLLVLAVPFGAISMLLSWLRRSAPAPTDPYQSAIDPFASLSDLRHAYRSTAFRKIRYPASVAGRRIRSPFMDRFNWFYVHVVWLLLSPVALFMQSLPRTETQVRVKVA